MRIWETKLLLQQTISVIQALSLKKGWIQRFRQEGALYVGHHSWPTKKILGFEWSKKANVTLETITFWRSMFKFSPMRKETLRKLNFVL